MAIYHANDQVIELNSANALHEQSKMAIKSVILTGASAGEFELRIGNTTFSLRTTAETLTVQYDLCRTANEIELVSEPSGGTVYVLLDQEP